jgi:hypothetical protein
VSSNRSSLGISLILLAAAAALVFVGLGQYRSYDQALRLCDELKKTNAALQASVARLEAGASRAGAAPAEGEEPRDEPGQQQPVEEIQQGAVMLEYMNMLKQRNEEQHEQDASRFGKELSGLYKEALDEEGTASRESNRAFNELIEKFPEAHATGMAIANRGLLAAMKLRTSDVEMFRLMLSRKDHFKRIVTDSNIDAYPALCGYLANRYVADARPEEAEALLAELVRDFGKSYIAIGGFGAKPLLVSVTRFAERVRREARAPSQPPAPPKRGPGGG